MESTVDHRLEIGAEGSRSALISGLGGRYAGGRWHHQGHLIVYTSATPSLAVLEILVHFDVGLAPPEYCLVEITIHHSVSMEFCQATDLSPHSDATPAPSALQDFGTRWLMEKRTAILEVPSAVMSLKNNYLINPEHPEARKILVKSVREYAFDHRLSR